MFARVFESWLESELDKRGTRNNYLVCGTGEHMVAFLEAPFPKGSERQLMFNRMGTLVQVVVAAGLLKA
jgi:hypothetical protein